MPTNTIGACESHPEKAGYPNRASADETIEVYRAQGVPAWPEKCGVCGAWHIFLATIEYEKQLKR